MSRTYAEIYNPAVKLQTKEEADRYLAMITDEWMEEGTDKHGEPLVRETVIRWHMENLGYWAGYFDHETRLRVEKLFGCQHPILGKAENGYPSPAEAFAMGSARTVAFVLACILSGLACSSEEAPPLDGSDPQTTDSQTATSTGTGTGTGTATSLPPDAGSPQTGTATATATRLAPDAGTPDTRPLAPDAKPPCSKCGFSQIMPCMLNKDGSWQCQCDLSCGAKPGDPGYNPHDSACLSNEAPGVWCPLTTSKPICACYIPVNGVPPLSGN